MKNLILILAIITTITSCNEKKEVKPEVIIITEDKSVDIEINDKRISLELNPMQKQHQLEHMRDHLEAVQAIIALLAEDKYEIASRVAYKKLGSTTEMKMMCGSFGHKQFETLGLEFHKSADEMSEVFKTKNKNKSLEALSNTMNYCKQCHQTFRQ
ncbi:MAG TPA: cytochrome C [Flavobacteriaceae bacterium]|nr:cytochrome C [Flavobacteriaceae bacterium]